MKAIRRVWRRLLCDIRRQQQLDALNDARMRRMMEARYRRKGY
jgi:hypothetical protein